MLRTAVAALAVTLAGCAPPGPRSVVLTFSGRVNDMPFACGGTYTGIGTTGTTLTSLDFRLYVHDVALVTADGTAVPVTIEEDGTWQTQGVVLLDFENGHGCEDGTVPMNFVVRGTVPGDGARYTGVQFRIGVPQSLDHLNADTQPSPLNVTSLFWNWTSGYTFLRIDGRTTGAPAGFRFHLGATGCTGDPLAGTTTCANPNTPQITLTGYDVDHDTIVIDQAGIFVGSDMDHFSATSGAGGCQSEVGNPDCVPMFAAIGLGATTQTAFHVVHPGP